MIRQQRKILSQRLHRVKEKSKANIFFSTASPCPVLKCEKFYLPSDQDSKVDVFFAFRFVCVFPCVLLRDGLVGKVKLCITCGKFGVLFGCVL